MMKNKSNLTAIIIAKDEAEMIVNCLTTLSWCQKVIVINNGSIDQTAELATRLGAEVVDFATDDFAALRNRALDLVKTDWLLYLDADERVTPSLSREILAHIESGAVDALILKRKNIFYGQVMRFGGWQEDRDLVTRIFRKKTLRGWRGRIHESPDFHGRTAILNQPLIHLSHRNTRDGLKKSMVWTGLEADLLFKAKTPPVTFFTLARKTLMEFYRRAIRERGYRDGLVGWIEAFIQAFNRLLVYVQLWERQQQPPLSKRYQKLEWEIAEQWRKNGKRT